jgi:hypothetical protein
LKNRQYDGRKAAGSCASFYLIAMQNLQQFVKKIQMQKIGFERLTADPFLT